MFVRLILCLAVASLAIASPARAQEDEQLWLQVNTNVPVVDGVRATLEQIARISDAQGGLYQTELGALLGVKLSDTVEFGFGYRWVEAHGSSTAPNENRLRQQVVATFGPLTTRLRIDERFHPAGEEIGFRVRPLLRYNIPLKPKGLALFVSHESFFLPNATAWGQRRGYERMRNIAGISVPIVRGVAADIGYLNQYRFARGGTRGATDHVLNLQLTINLRDIAAPRVHD